MSTLYELTAEFQAAIARLESAEESEAVELEKLLDGLGMQADQKLEGCWKWCRNLDAQAAAIDAETKLLNDRKEQIEAEQDRFLAYVGRCLNGESYKNGMVKFVFHRSSSAECLDDKLTPREFVEVELVEKTKKMEILKELRAGVGVPGWRLKETISLKAK